MSTVRVTSFRIALELLVELVDNILLGPTGGVLKSKVTSLAIVTARVIRHNQISRASVENLVTTMSWICNTLEKVSARSGLDQDTWQ